MAEGSRLLRQYRVRAADRSRMGVCAHGPDGWIYPWGNEMNASYRQEAEMLNPYDVESVDVASSWIGAQAMSGNMMEWVSERRLPPPYHLKGGVPNRTSYDTIPLSA
jgi:hypothetical protein